LRGYSSDQRIAQVQQATDIVRLISEYLPLKRAGRNYKALCPFHQEKTPSFMVNPQLQIYKCFGCGAGGNVFGFVMRREAVSFPEALRMLAERAGIKLEERPQEQKQARQKEKLFALNAWAADYFRQKLLSSEGAQARNYLSSRRIEPATVERFKLGWSPDAWDHLLQQGARKGYSSRLLEQAGLVVPRDSTSGYYDRFRARLMFPICDVRGRVVGFGGRILKEDVVKYVNSPTTVLFDKSRSLYGLDVARSPIASRRQVAVVEGYTDCLMAHQMGIDWVVATLGTALTSEHLRELRRYADEVILVFDADAAGARAAERTLEMFLREELEARLAVLEPGLDPCDFLIKFGKDAFQRKLDHAVPLFRQLLEAAREKLESGSAPQRARACDELLEEILKCPDLVRCELLVRQMAEYLNLSYESLHGRMRRLRRGGSAPTVAEERKQGIGAQREANLLTVLLARPELGERIIDEIPLEAFEQPEYRAIAEQVYHQYRENGALDFQRLLTVMTEQNLDSKVVGLSQDRPPDFDFDNLLASCLSAFRSLGKKRGVQAIRSKLKQARAAGDERAENEALASHLEALRKKDKDTARQER